MPTFKCLKPTLLSFAMLMMAASQAQVPTNQDCLGAIPVCQEIYEQDLSYSGTGNYPNEIPTPGSCPTNCLSTGERNDVWYIFTVQSSGMLSFTVTPNNSNNDYDWAVYSLNIYDCEDLFIHIGEMQVSCNYSATPGPTGPNGNGNQNCVGSVGSPFNAEIPVLEGQTYVINISNFSSSQSGYTLDFSASSANIFDNVRPQLSEVDTDDLICGSESFVVEFSEKVKCNSVQPGDFALTGPGGPYTITQAFGSACALGGEMENQFTLFFDPPIFENGAYSLNINALALIEDNCGNTTLTQSFPFNVNLNAPEVYAGPDQEIAYAASTFLDADVMMGSGNFEFLWEPADKLVNPFVEDPETQTLVETTTFDLLVIDQVTNCQSGDEVLVSILGGPMSLLLNNDVNELCLGSPVQMEAIPSGGSGDYSFSWSSDPPGVNSNEPLILVFPETTTTFTVEVTDGVTTLIESVTITVFENPVAVIQDQDPIFANESVTLQGSALSGQAPYQFSWSPQEYLAGPNNIPNPVTIPLLESQEFLLTITDANGCVSETRSILIRVQSEALSVDVDAEVEEICFGESVLISAFASGGTPNKNFEWYIEDQPDIVLSTDTTIVVTPTSTTTYFVRVDDGISTDSASVNIAVHPNPVANIKALNYEINEEGIIYACITDTVFLDAGDDANPPGEPLDYLWSNGLPEQIYNVKTNGVTPEVKNISVDLTYTNTGCSSSDEIIVFFDFSYCDLSVDEAIIRESFKVSPIPASEEIIIHNYSSHHILNLRLYNTQGQLIQQNDLLVRAQPKEISWLLKPSKPGTYLLAIQTSAGSIVQKIIIY